MTKTRVWPEKQDRVGGPGHPPVAVCANYTLYCGGPKRQYQPSNTGRSETMRASLGAQSSLII